MDLYDKYYLKTQPPQTSTRATSAAQAPWAGIWGFMGGGLGAFSGELWVHTLVTEVITLAITPQK
eukprot:2474052-Amphidinium_carterae.1